LIRWLGSAACPVGTFGQSIEIRSWLCSEAQTA
jgi:hypothetical protein